MRGKVEKPEFSSPKEPSVRKPEFEKQLRKAEIRIGFRYDQNGIPLKDALAIMDKARDDFFTMKKTDVVPHWVAEWLVKWFGAKPREEFK